ncbi:MAG: alpha/beta hydrolase [Saccharolobus sp.]|uniref:alpha/beta fold hydrolase n=1 Tax=Saccharolobus TaxID=2100760 RepID=UPI001F1169CE|nr:alpha/beta hydrolase [Saccharolobus shibatae]MCH4815785.1 alpha/beta hydrolase [Saccharolobus shibatae]
MSLHSKRLIINDAEISFYDLGQSEKTIVFLHSFNHSKLMWIYQIPDFVKAGYRVIVPDFRGHGDSEYTPGKISMEILAKDIVELLKEINIKKAVIVGSSMGGFVAFNMWRIANYMISGLILAGTKAHPDGENEKSRRMSQIQILKEKGVKDFVNAFAYRRLSKYTIEHKPWVVDLVRLMSMNMEKEAIIETLQALMMKSDDTKILRDINVPTLIVCGKEDMFTPCNYSQFMHENIEKSRLVIMDNASHMCVMDQPENFNETSLQFLRENNI